MSLEIIKNKRKPITDLKNDKNYSTSGLIFLERIIYLIQFEAEYRLIFDKLSVCVRNAFLDYKKICCMNANETTLHERPHDTDINNYWYPYHLQQ